MTNRMSRDQLSHSTDQKRSSRKKLTAPTLAQGGRGLIAFGEIFPLFCASGFGLYSVMVESISGDRAQIISKAILDFFIALIYGGSMGIAISLVAVPQLAVFTCFFFLAKVLIPMMSDAMLTNFIACGGVLSIAAGMRMAKIRQYPVIDMLPALALILVLTPLWERLFP